MDLISNIFEQCFHTCKTCSKSGNESNHNCEQCITGYQFNSEISSENNCYEKCEFFYYFDSSNKYQCTEKRLCPQSYKLISPKNKCVKNCSEDDIYTF